MFSNADQGQGKLNESKLLRARARAHPHAVTSNALYNSFMAIDSYRPGYRPNISVVCECGECCQPETALRIHTNNRIRAITFCRAPMQLGPQTTIFSVTVPEQNVLQPCVHRFRTVVPWSSAHVTAHHVHAACFKTGLLQQFLVCHSACACVNAGV